MGVTIFLIFRVNNLVISHCKITHKIRNNEGQDEDGYKKDNKLIDSLLSYDW